MKKCYWQLCSFVAACISTRAFSNIPQKQLLFKPKSD